MYSIPFLFVHIPSLQKQKKHEDTFVWVHVDNCRPRICDDDDNHHNDNGKGMHRHGVSPSPESAVAGGMESVAFQRSVRSWIQPDDCGVVP